MTQQCRLVDEYRMEYRGQTLANILNPQKWGQASSQFFGFHQCHVKELREMVLKVLSGSNQCGFKSIKDLSEGDCYFLIKLFSPFVSLKPVHEVASGCVLCAVTSPPPPPITLSRRMGERWLAQQLADSPGFTLRFNDPFLVCHLSHLLKNRYKLYL